MNKLTYVMENYLEAIYELSKDTSFARTSDIATRLGVSKASVNSAVQTLISKGLITSEKYREIYLTDEGKKLAELTYKKHRVIKEFFITVLGIDEETADADACAIEHVISQDSIKAIGAYLKSKKLK